MYSRDGVTQTFTDALRQSITIRIQYRPVEMLGRAFPCWLVKGQEEHYSCIRADGC
jgi:hypothetical protein